MSSGLEEKVEEIITEYLKPSNRVHLVSMVRIYRNLTGEDIEGFSSWDDAIQAFQDLDWNNDLLREFAQISKQVSQGGETRKSETYFNIVAPDEVSHSYVVDEFEREPYQADASGPSRDGFKWENQSNGSISGQYVYTDIDKELAFNGDLKQLESDGFIEFRIDPDRDLLILESTSVIDVQKARKYFGRKTNMEIAVCGPLTSFPERAVDCINSFLDRFEEGFQDPNSDEPGLLQIDEIRLHYPDSDEEDENLENIDFEGDDIGDHNDVSERLSQGWIIKGFSAPLHFKGDTFTMTVAGTGMMAYAKVEGSTDLRKSGEAMDIIRDRYMDEIRQYSP